MNRQRLFFFAGFLLLLAGAASSAKSADSPDLIRVAVVEGAPEVRLSAGSSIRLSAGKEEVLSSESPLVIRAGENGLIAGGRPVGRAVRVRAATPIEVNGRTYPGEVEVRASGEGRLVAINHVDLESYVAGVVPSEVPASWNIEVLKAQAVIARTYALSLRQRTGGQPFHIGSGVEHQVYSGAWANIPRVQEAVRATRGEVLSHNGELAEAVYHAYCGGVTENASDVWGRGFPYLKSVSSKCLLYEAPPSWTYYTLSDDLASRLRTSGLVFGGAVQGIEPADLSQTGRIRTIRIVTPDGPREMRGIDFRKAVGPELIRSTRFAVEQEGNGFRFVGIGFGHGVGLCQHGARTMADEGAGYREILAHYFPGTAIRPWTKVKRNNQVRLVNG